MKILLTILAILYALSPYDIFPDFAVGWGWLDDLLILFLLWRFVYSVKKSPFLNRGRYNRNYQYFNKGNHRSQNTGAGAKQPFEGDSSSSDPYRVLGIERNASEDEIKRAYRQLANKYHPDKVYHLGEEFKKLAEQRFKEIEEAYRILKKR
jgi:DnaJ like chaperone protein